MGAVLRRVLLGCALALPLACHAQAPAAAEVKHLFVEPVALRGTLGGDQIQMNLRTKQEYADGVEGDYFRFGHSLKVLLAGEIEGDEVFLEESENGTDVSGEWNGKLTGDVFSGEWLSADGKRSQPFSIRIVRTQDKPGRTPAK